MDLVERVKILLINRARGGYVDESEFVDLRRTLINEPIISAVLPKFLFQCRTIQEFWTFIKTKYGKYDERTFFITEEFQPVFEKIETVRSNDIELANTESYQLLDRIGHGGFGEVYRYHHKLINMDFAIKFLNPSFVPEEEKSEFNRRFFREAKILFELDHPHIVKIFDVGMVGGKPFIRMEYLEGKNLNELLKEQSVRSFSQSKYAIIPILKGMAYAHGKGIIHRDLKLTNIMQTRNKGLKIIDFGISAYVNAAQHTNLTKTGEVINDSEYADPELIINPNMKDIRSDIYSIGAIWYTLLTGRAPRGSDILENLLSNESVDDENAKIIMKCLAQKKESRFSSCNDILHLLGTPNNAEFDF